MFCDMDEKKDCSSPGTAIKYKLNVLAKPYLAGSLSAQIVKIRGKKKDEYMFQIKFYFKNYVQ